MSTLQNLSIEAQREALRRAHDEVWKRQQERLRLNRELIETVRRGREALREDARSADAAEHAHAADVDALRALHDRLTRTEAAWEQARQTVDARLAETDHRAQAAADAADALAGAVRTSTTALDRIERDLREALHHLGTGAGDPERSADIRARLDHLARLGSEVGLMVRDARLLVPTALTLLAMDAGGYTLRDTLSRDGLIAYFVSADRSHQVAVRHHREPESDLAFRMEVETFEQEGEACLDVLDDFVVGMEETHLAAVAWAAPRRYPKRDGESGIPVPARVASAVHRTPRTPEPPERG